MISTKNIAGCNILITGGAQRIGASLAKYLASKKANIIIHYNNSSEQASLLLTELPQGNHRIIQGDLKNYSQFIEQLNKLDITVDVLINNAAVFNVKNIESENDCEINEQMTINFLAPYALMKWFYSQKLLQNGVIVNFLDQRNIKPDKMTGSYAISKKALEQATLAGGLQFAPKVRVNGIAPGPVLAPNDYEGVGFERALDNVPMKEKIDLDCICEAVEFLIRNKAVTGQILYVDGGEHLS